MYKEVPKKHTNVGHNILIFNRASSGVFLAGTLWSDDESKNQAVASSGAGHRSDADFRLSQFVLGYHSPKNLTSEK